MIDIMIPYDHETPMKADNDIISTTISLSVSNSLKD